MERIIVDDESCEQILTIDGVVINNVIFQAEKVDYDYRDRKDFIDNLCDWIGETSGNDRELMKEDLIYLSSLDDEYIFNSIVTNEYIALSDNKDNFNSICDDILAEHKKVLL